MEERKGSMKSEKEKLLDVLGRMSNVLETKTLVTSYEALVSDDLRRIKPHGGAHCAICAAGDPIETVMKLQEIEVTSEQGSEEWLEARQKVHHGLRYGHRPVPKSIFKSPRALAYKGFQYSFSRQYRGR